MKKFLLMLGAAVLMTACSDDGDGSGSGSINYEEGYKYLSSLNVSDAKMIYQKTSGASMKSRAAGDEDGTYYKLDLNGNESKLVITGKDGQDYNIGINKVVKLSDPWPTVSTGGSSHLRLAKQTRGRPETCHHAPASISRLRRGLPEPFLAGKLQ